MAKGTWRGVGGVSRKVKKQWRGVGGVARNIKAEWRGVGGVARQVFGGSGLVLYDYGYNPYNFQTHNANSSLASVTSDSLHIIRGDSYNQGDVAPFITDKISDMPSTLSDYNYIKVIATKSFFTQTDSLIYLYFSQYPSTLSSPIYGISFLAYWAECDDKNAELQTRYYAISDSNKTKYANYYSNYYSQYGSPRMALQSNGGVNETEVGDYETRFYSVFHLPWDVYHISLVADKG